MTAIVPESSELRREAAKIAFALIRFSEAVASQAPFHTQPGLPVVGVDAYNFTPSWRSVRREDVEDFLAALPSPALLSPTLTRGVVALTLLHELSGDRRRWAEKTFSNFAEGFDEMSAQLKLSAESRILLEFDAESHVLSFAGTRLWTQLFAVQVGWNVAPLRGDARAEAQLTLVRSDGTRAPPLPPGFRRV